MIWRIQLSLVLLCNDIFFFIYLTVVSSNSAHYVIKFVSNLRQWFSPGIPVSSTNKIDRQIKLKYC